MPVMIERAAVASDSDPVLSALLLKNPKPIIDMIIVAKNSDLELPEYPAFNHEEAQPSMRPWELPFVLVHSGLASPTISVFPMRRGSFRWDQEKFLKNAVIPI